MFNILCNEYTHFFFFFPSIPGSKKLFDGRLFNYWNHRLGSKSRLHTKLAKDSSKSLLGCLELKLLDTQRILVP